jgi:hypothetical protein
MKHPCLFKIKQLVPILREGHDYSEQTLKVQVLKIVDVLPHMREPLKKQLLFAKTHENFS